MTRSNRDRIKTYFRSELEELRLSGREFADAYPAIASELSLSAGVSRDPHVEHLVQSFAWMMSRLRMQVESETKKIPSMLLEELAPGFIEARPPMSIAECQVDSSGIETSVDLKLEQGLSFAPVNVRSDADTAASLAGSRFAVAHSCQLWPFKVVDVQRNPVKETNEISQHFSDSRSVLKIAIESESGSNVSALQLDKPLRFFINMEQDWAYRFYDLIASQIIGVGVSDAQGNITRVLDKAKFKLCGFGDEERLFGLSSSDLLGTSVLQDFFSFPEKFLFFEISGLSDLALVDYEFEGATRVNLHLVLDQLISKSLPLDVNSLKLNCVPLINLFDKTTDPVVLNDKSYRYKLIADRSSGRDIEVQSLEEVFLVDRDGIEYPAKPYFSVQNTSDLDEGIYWVAQKEETSRRDTPGSDIWISVFTQSDIDIRGMALYAKTKCNNRRLAEALVARQEMALLGAAPVTSCRLLMRPTRYLAPEMDKDSLWKLMGTLTRHHLSMALPDAAKDNLMLTLSLCSSAEDDNAQRLLESVESVLSAEDYEPSRISGWRGYQRGTRYTLTLNERLFQGSAMMFGRVVLHFLALFSQVNSFSSLDVYLGDRKVHRWPPTTGHKAVA